MNIIYELLGYSVLIVIGYSFGRIHINIKNRLIIFNLQRQVKKLIDRIDQLDKEYSEMYKYE